MAVETLLGTDGPAYVDVNRVVVTLTAGTVALASGVPGKKIRVLEYAIGADAVATLQFKSNTTAITGAIPMVAGAYANANFSPVGVFETAAGEDLKVTQVGTANLGGWLNYALI